MSRILHVSIGNNASAASKVKVSRKSGGSVVDEVVLVAVVDVVIDRTVSLVTDTSSAEEHAASATSEPAIRAQTRNPTLRPYLGDLGPESDSQRPITDPEHHGVRNLVRDLDLYGEKSSPEHRVEEAGAVGEVGFDHHVGGAGGAGDLDRGVTLPVTDLDDQ